MHRRKEHENLARPHRRPGAPQTLAPQPSANATDESASSRGGLPDTNQLVDGIESVVGQVEGLQAKRGEGGPEYAHPRCQWTRANGTDTCWRRAVFVGHMFCLSPSPPPVCALHSPFCALSISRGICGDELWASWFVCVRPVRRRVCYYIYL
jgi:hypothetical protein